MAYFLQVSPPKWVGIAQSVWRLAKGWAVRSNPVKTDPGPHPASCTVGTVSVYQGYSGREEVTNQPSCSAEVKIKSTAIHLLPVWAFNACSRVKLTFTFPHKNPVYPHFSPTRATCSAHSSGFGHSNKIW